LSLSTIGLIYLLTPVRAIGRGPATPPADGIFRMLCRLIVRWMRLEAMQVEIATDPLQGADLRHDLEANLGRLKALGVLEISLLFGFSWGKHIYEKQWKELPVSPDQAQVLVHRAEKQGFGRLGDDNLYLTVERFNLRLQYSHEADIHLSFGTPNRLVHDILDRWIAMQWLCYNQSRALEKVLGRA
jgi:hypothetical protein